MRMLALRGRGPCVSLADGEGPIAKGEGEREMRKRESVWRTSRIVVAAAALLVGLAGVGSPGGASAAETKAVAAAPALPQTLTRENARDVLSRLSDAQVRSLLLEQLDRASGAEGQAATEGGM